MPGAPTAPGVEFVSPGPPHLFRADTSVVGHDTPQNSPLTARQLSWDSCPSGPLASPVSPQLGTCLSSGTLDYTGPAKASDTQETVPGFPETYIQQSPPQAPVQPTRAAAHVQQTPATPAHVEPPLAAAHVQQTPAAAHVQQTPAAPAHVEQTPAAPAHVEQTPAAAHVQQTPGAVKAEPARAEPSQGAATPAAANPPSITLQTPQAKNLQSMYEDGSYWQSHGAH